jgi:hypothetical protein
MIFSKQSGCFVLEDTQTPSSINKTKEKTNPELVYV